MTEAAVSPLFSYTAKVPVPEHLSLPALVLYLHLEFDNDAHRGRQLTSLFYNEYKPTNGVQKLEEIIAQDKKSADCLAAALQAIERGEIEVYEKDYDFEAFEPDKLKTPEFYTVSFLVWAEKTGVQIPKYIRDELDTQIKYYFMSQPARNETRHAFPTIRQESFIWRLNEPLWKMTDALLYVLGYQSTAVEVKKIGFLQYKPRAKRLMGYIMDARRANDLKLYDFDDHMFDHDQTNVDEKRIKSFYASSVKPKDLVTWLHTLSLDLPMVEQYVLPEVPIQSAVNVSVDKQGLVSLLHPVIVKSSYQHYLDGHLRDAVLNSVVAVFDYVREKTGLPDDGDKLIGQAFSLTDPFIIMSEITSESGQNDQKGFMQIFKGAYQGIRNPKAHSLIHDLTEAKAAQYLVFASLLARRVEDATFPKVAQLPSDQVSI